jgi:hypothetical protein
MPDTGRRLSPGPGRSGVIARAFVFVACFALAPCTSATTLYAEKTDQELTQLAAGWEALSDDERRALLTEIKARMHANSAKRGVLTIKTERRYGRIVRRPDGSLMRIETTEQLVRYQAVPEGATDRPFGVGFEQRVEAPAADAGDAAPQSAPATQLPSVISVGTAAPG